MMQHAGMGIALCGCIAVFRWVATHVNRSLQFMVSITALLCTSSLYEFPVDVHTLQSWRMSAHCLATIGYSPTCESAGKGDNATAELSKCCHHWKVLVYTFGW